jgi:hypothetical protein
MTFQQIKEAIKQVFPERTLSEYRIVDTLVGIDVNRIYKEYVRKTRLVKNSYDESIEENVVTYTLSDSVSEIYNISFLDSSEKEVSQTEQLRFSINDRDITFYDYYGQELTAIPSLTIRYFYIEKVDSMVGDSDEPEFDEELHDALIAGVLADYLARYPSLTVQFDDRVELKRDLQGAAWWANKYQEKIKDGKRISNRNKNSCSTNGVHDNF